MENVEIRVARNRKEIEQAFDLWTEVFPEDRSFFQERVDFYHYCDPETTWIAKVDGKLVSAVHIFPYFMRLESTILKVGGIAYVATLPEYRGRSLAQTILKRQSDWMKHHGYDLSMLFTPINPFYEKIGWQTVPRQSYSLKKLHLPAIDEIYTVSEFTETDLKAVQKIYQLFNRNYVGPRIKTADYWEGQMKWDPPKSGEFLVAKRDGAMVGYLRSRFSDDREIELNECCYLPGEEQAAVALVKETLLRNQDFKKIQVSVPDSHVLVRLFEEAGAEKETVTSDMWKVFHLKGLLEKLKPVLQERLNRASDKKSFVSTLLQCGDSEVVLSLPEDILDIQEPTESLRYQQLMKCDESEMVSMLLRGAENCKSRTMSILFPKQSYQIWENDSF